MLYLNANDIERILSLRETVDTIEKALLLMSKKKFFMPERFHIAQGNNTLLLMPCFTEKYFGTKLVSVFPDNSKKSLPVIYGNMMLNDASTGEVVAIIDGAKLTAMRTGAVGSLGIRYLASPKSKNLAIIGAGVQGAYQAIFACSEAASPAGHLPLPGLGHREPPGPRRAHTGDGRPRGRDRRAGGPVPA